MQTFTIGIWEEQGGYLEVKAESLNQARKRAQDYIDNYGFELINDKPSHIVSLRNTHRDTSLI